MCSLYVGRHTHTTCWKTVGFVCPDFPPLWPTTTTTTIITTTHRNNKPRRLGSSLRNPDEIVDPELLLRNTKKRKHTYEERLASIEVLVFLWVPCEVPGASFSQLLDLDLGAKNSQTERLGNQP